MGNEKGGGSGGDVIMKGSAKGGKGREKGEKGRERECFV